MTVKIEKTIAHGQGLARHNGQVIFVDAAYAGEVLRVKIIESKKDFATAIVEEIIEPSPNRVEPTCSHYYACGGCDAQTLSHESQVDAKIDIVKESFQRFARIELAQGEKVLSKPWHYRSRIQAQINGEKRGFMELGTRNILPISECPIISNELFTEMQKSREEGRVLLVDPQQFKTFDEHYEVMLQNQVIRFGKKSFFQNNIETFDQALTWLKTQLEPGSELIEAYAGCGVLSAVLKEKFQKITMIESDRENIRFAKLNCEPHEITVYDRPVEKVLSHLRIAEPESSCFLVDPPRDGMTKVAIEFMRNNLPKNFIYISCNPVTQARDFKAIKDMGYTIKNWAFWDFYPQTWHIETCIIAERI